jgi:nicotinic acid mononucleotide adenylyltransferase
MGGSYSPPTSAHHKVAMAMGIFLSEKYPTDSIGIAIVPVSSAYNKSSVRESCISTEDRLTLVNTMAGELNGDKMKPANVAFFVMTHEIYEKDHPTSTIDSLSYMRIRFPTSQLYIAQGQDNIMAILRREWDRSDELLKYSFLMYPRGSGVTKESITEQMHIELEKISPKDIAPITRNDIRNEIIERIHILDVEFNDDTSSTRVRNKIAHNEPVNDMMMPAVLAALREIQDKNPALYKEGCVTHGGKRTRRRRRKSRKYRVHKSTK